jgi:hypothetical protein
VGRITSNGRAPADEAAAAAHTSPCPASRKASPSPSFDRSGGMAAQQLQPAPAVEPQHAGQPACAPGLTRRQHLEWFRAHYPQAAPPSRKAVAEVRRWLDAQLQQLRSQVGEASGRGRSGSPGRAGGGAGGWQQQVAELGGTDAQLLVPCLALVRRAGVFAQGPAGAAGAALHGLLRRAQQVRRRAGQRRWRRA